MTQDELIQQNVRMLLGDLQLQLIIARARISELEAGASPDPEAGLGKPNGQAQGKELDSHEQDYRSQ
jgi:hypothetical protein